MNFTPSIGRQCRHPTVVSDEVALAHFGETAAFPDKSDITKSMDVLEPGITGKKMLAGDRMADQTCCESRFRPNFSTASIC